MKTSDFQRLPDKMPDKPMPGDQFLEGERMVEQKTNKNPGDHVSYYVVVAVHEQSVEFSTEFSILTRE